MVIREIPAHSIPLRLHRHVDMQCAIRVSGRVDGFRPDVRIGWQTALFPGEGAAVDTYGCAVVAQIS